MKRFLHSWEIKWKVISLIFLTNIIIGFCIGQVTINGTVTNKKGGVVTGVSVMVKNTSFGTTTDNSGKYSLPVVLKSGTYVIEFSAIGLKTQEQGVSIGSQSSYTVNITLNEDALSLDEVILTGTSLGTTRKQLGSYISTVKGDQLSKGATGNVLAALQGKTAGAQISQNSGDPAGGISVRLRGVSTINSSSEPLYIVDGIIVNNGTNRVTNTSAGYDGGAFVGTIGQNRLVDINPADIDRIEVLNGAAASAIYGSRANAGVIQIFTKRGSIGAPQVSFTTGIMTSKLRKKLDVNQAPTKFGGSPDVQTQDILNPALTNTTAVTRYDYQDYIFHTGMGTDNNISVSGGRDKTKFFTSASYFFNQGIVKNTDFQRYSFRLNLDQVLNNWISFNGGINFTNSIANEKPDGNSFFSPTNSVTILGNIHDIQTRDALGNIKAVGERGRTNPVSVIEDIKQREETNRMMGNIGLKLKPTRGLTFDYTLGIDQYSQRGATFIPPFAYNVNTAFFGGGATLDPTLNGYASTATDNFFQINHEVNGTYQFNINNDLSSTTQVGFSQQYEKNNYSLLQGRGLAPFVQTVNGASTGLPSVDDRSEISISGAYAQQNFKYKSMFFLTGAVRVDGSSVFGKDQRNQLYLKGAGSLVLSEGSFWSSLADWWDLCKVRMAYGQSGNLTGIGAYSRFNTYSTSSFLGRTGLFSSSTLANENVQPERQKELEIGTDLTFLKNRIGLQFNWYNKKIDHLLFARFVAPTTGYSSLLDNIGSLENKGFEIVLNLTPVKTDDLKWDLTGIYNHNRNKVIKIGQSLLLLGTNAGAPVAIIEGQPVGVFYGTFFAVDGSGNWIKNTLGYPLIEKGLQNAPLSYTTQRDAQGLPLSTATTLRKIVGDPNPDYTASLVSDLSYKKLSFRLQFDAVQGNEVFNADFRTRQGVGNGKVAEDEHNGKIPRGWVNSVYQIEQWRIDDGSFVKLREASLSYSVGKTKHFHDLTLTLSGRNLISWDKYKGYDPEVNAAGQSTILRGIDFGSTPAPRTFSFSINVKL